MTVHCCGCRGPSVLRGPVEPLEEAVPDELWPPGDGNDGLLYGRHPSSGDASGKQRTFFKFDFYCGGETRLTSDAGTPLVTSAEWQCQQAMPGRAAERTLPRTWPRSHRSYGRVNTIRAGPLAAVAPPAAGHHNIDPQQSPPLREISSNCFPLLS